MSNALWRSLRLTLSAKVGFSRSIRALADFLAEANFLLIAFIQRVPSGERLPSFHSSTSSLNHCLSIRRSSSLPRSVSAMYLLSICRSVADSFTPLKVSENWKLTSTPSSPKRPARLLLSLEPTSKGVSVFQIWPA
uniref:Uncharacterized protein n=1 Tax=uncultured marine virus TaxID=186617 RepID=A0A0F7LCL9_9VIRU|nr:hypothetical protein [uncultured marine virus]